MKKLVTMIIASLVFVSLSVCAAQKAQTSPEKLLFVMNAPLGQIIKTNNQWKLVLQPAPKNVHYFTDRPQRKVGMIGLKKFLTVWNQPGKDTFKKDAPNAAMIAVLDAEGSVHHKDSFIVLSSPKYHHDTNTLSFSIKSLQKENQLKLAVLKGIVLFIDNAQFINAVIPGYIK